MTLPGNLREIDVRELRKALSDTSFLPSSAVTGRSLYAVAGAGDVAVEKLRALGLPAQARRLPAVAQGAVHSAVTDLGNRAGAVYGDLADRGQDVVRRIRGQEATQEAVTSVGTTAKRTRKTTSTAKKSAARTGTAAKKTARSASASAKAAAKAVEDGASELG